MTPGQSDWLQWAYGAYRNTLKGKYVHNSFLWHLNELTGLFAVVTEMARQCWIYRGQLQWLHQMLHFWAFRQWLNLDYCDTCDSEARKEDLVLLCYSAVSVFHYILSLTAAGVLPSLLVVISYTVCSNDKFCWILSCRSITEVSFIGCVNPACMCMCALQLFDT